MKRFISLTLCVMLVFALYLPAPAEGVDITWTGAAGDGLWHTAGNWSPAKVPGPGDTAVIPAAAAVTVASNTEPVTLDCSGEVEVAAGAHLYLEGTSYLKSEEGKLDGDGNITIKEGGELRWSGGLIDGNGLFTLEENTSLVIDDLSGEEYPNVSLGRSMVNNGQVTVNEGELYLYGAIEGDGTFIVSEGAYLSFEEGDYDIGGDFVNCGDVSIWDDASVHFSAGYRQEDTGTLALKVWGTDPSEYCKLDVTGEAHLGGILEIDFLSGYNPQEGDSFEMVTCGSRIGEFSYLINNMEKDGISMVPSYTGTGLTLTVSESEFAGGSGTEDDPYLVANAYHLNNVRKYLNAHFLQISNIDLSSYSFVDYGDGIGWEPIGTSNTPFSGTFNGGGYTISNLYIERHDYYTGLFGYISPNGKVSNVKLESVDVTSNYDHVGGLAGLSKGLIDNCIVTGRVLAYGWHYPVGGLMGENQGTITYCSFDGLVSGGDDYCGGLVGRDEGTIIGCHTKGTVKGDDMVGGLVGYKVNDSGVIMESYSECNVEGSGYDIGGLVGNNDGRLEGCFALGNVKGTSYVGGLVGYNYTPGGNIINCYALGSVEGSNYVGGLAGGNSNSITCCYSAGEVKGETGAETGGLVGTATENGSVDKSYWDSETSLQSTSAGGEGRSTAEMKQQGTYEEWDFDTIWNINASYNDGYPFLRWQISVATVPTAPQNFTATPGDTQVALNWTVPTDDGGADIIRYEVFCDKDGEWVTADTSTSHTFTGLTNGIEYTFKVRAVNAIGPGAQASATATPIAPPAPTYTVTVTNGTGGGEYTEGATVTITANSAPDGQRFKQWQVISGGITLANPTEAITSFLMPANAVEVVATYEAIPTVPTAPQNFTATPGYGQVALSWTAPENNGSAAISHYEVSSDNGITWVMVSTGTSHTFTDLTNGTEYTFKVRAVNSAGQGEEAITTATPTSAPVPTYTVTVINGTGSGAYAQGVTVTISAYSAPDGQQFREWQVVSGDVELEDPKAPSTTFIMPANDVEITAVYEEIPVITYTVTVNGSYAATTGAGSYAQGDTVTINAGSRANYSFSGWTSPDGVTFANPNSATTTFIMPAKNVTVTANWTYTGHDDEEDEDEDDDEDIDEGDDEDGDDTGDSVPPTQESSLSPTYNANVKTKAGTETAVPVAVDKDKGTASVDIDPDKLPQGAVNITMPSIPDVDAYSVSIPVQDLSTAGAQDAFPFNTEAGSVTVPSNMLSGITVPEGDKAQITIGQGDKSGLPDGVREAIGDRPLIQLTLSIDGTQTDWNNPDVPVTVTIPYTPTAEELENPEGIVVWYIDGSGNVISVPNGRYDPATGTVTFTTTHFSYYAVSYRQVSFSDVPKDAWYAKAVSFIAARDITKGTGGGNFSPDAKLTRAQFIVMLMRAYGIVSDENPADNFADAGDTWYTGYLAAAKRLKISNGVGDNMFAPDREITRQEMFTLLYNTLKTAGQLPGLHGQAIGEADDQPTNYSGKTLTDFIDAGDIAPWARVAMKRLVEAGIISGSGNRLSPKDTASRAQMAQVLYNLMSK